MRFSLPTLFIHTHRKVHWALCMDTTQEPRIGRHHTPVNPAMPSVHFRRVRRRTSPPCPVRASEPHPAETCRYWTGGAPALLERGCFGSGRQASSTEGRCPRGCHRQPDEMRPPPQRWVRRPGRPGARWRPLPGPNSGTGGVPAQLERCCYGSGGQASSMGGRPRGSRHRPEEMRSLPQRWICRQGAHSHSLKEPTLGTGALALQARLPSPLK